jgi:large subunit ribosomal protein L4
MALCSALTLKRREDKLLILDKIQLEEIKTREFINILKTLGATNVLIIEGENNKLKLSARNVPGVKVLSPDGLNLRDLLFFDELYITQPCLEKIQRRLLS